MDLGLKRSKKSTLTPLQARLAELPIGERLSELNKFEQETRTGMSGTLAEIEARLNEIAAERTKVSSEIHAEQKEQKELARRQAIESALQQYGELFTELEEEYRSADRLLVELVEKVHTQTAAVHSTKQRCLAAHGALLTGLRAAGATTEEISSRVRIAPPVLTSKVVVVVNKALKTADLGTVIQSIASETDDWSKLPLARHTLIAVDRCRTT